MAWCAAARDVPHDLAHVVCQFAGFLRLDTGPGPVLFELHSDGLVTGPLIVRDGAFFHTVYQVFNVPLFGTIEVLVRGRKIDQRDHVPFYVHPQAPAFLPMGCGIKRTATLRLRLCALGRSYVEDELDLQERSSTVPCGTRRGAWLQAKKGPPEPGGDRLFVRFALHLSHPVAVDMTGCQTHAPTTDNDNGRAWVLIATDPYAAECLHGSLVP